jgi:hypothetical protein
MTLFNGLVAIDSHLAAILASTSLSSQQAVLIHPKNSRRKDRHVGIGGADDYGASTGRCGSGRLKESRDVFCG